MSTNLNNGMVLRNCTLEDALMRLQAVRDECLSAMATAIAERVASELTFFKDLAMNFQPLNRGKQDFWTVMDALNAAKRRVAGDGVRDTDWDFTFEVCLIPHGPDLLLLWFIENNPGYLQSLGKIGAQDYHYQNSSDRPDGISREDWDRRESDWNSHLPGATAPAHVGLHYTIIDWSDIKSVVWDSKLVASALPSTDKRSKRVAVHLTELEVGGAINGRSIFDLCQKVMELAEERREHILLCEKPFADHI